MAEDAGEEEQQFEEPPTAKEENTPVAKEEKKDKYSSKPQKSSKNTKTTAQKPAAEKCRPRIEQLAIPSRRLILALYQEHAHNLSREKVEKVKILLQELYAMTPEETERYFEHLQNDLEELEKRKNIKFMLKRLMRKKNRAKKIEKAYEFVKKLLIKSLEYATKHQVPPLVSIRLRNLSNIILEQICDLKNVKIPNRDETDEAGLFLIQAADWMAIAIEQLYYKVQLKKNEELEKIEREPKKKTPPKSDDGDQKKEKAEKTKEKEDKSTPKQEDETAAAEEQEAVLSQELLVSEME